MIHLLQNNEGRWGSDEDGVELGRGWWFWGLRMRTVLFAYIYICKTVPLHMLRIFQK